MAYTTMYLDIVSAEAEIYSGAVQSLVASGKSGELGIFPGHTALLTALKPGQITVVLENGDEEIFYMSGGMLEVQPQAVTVLADTAVRAADLDEAAALAAKDDAEKKLVDRAAGVEYTRALSELAEASAQLRAIQMIRQRSGRN